MTPPSTPSLILRNLDNFPRPCLQLGTKSTKTYSINVVAGSLVLTVITSTAVVFLLSALIGCFLAEACMYFTLVRDFADIIRSS